MLGGKVKGSGRTLCALAVGAAVALALASAAPAQHAQSKRCPRGTLTLKLKGRRVCVRLTTPPQQFDKSSLNSEFGFVRSDAVHYKRGVSKRKKRAAAALRRASFSSEGEHALSGVLGVSAATRQGADDWSTHVDGSDIPPPDGSQGGGSEVVATATKDVSGGQIQMTFQDKHSFVVKSCPDAKGEVPGTAMQEYRYVIAGSGSGGRVSGVVDIKAEAAELGHVADTGHLKTYDHSMKMTGLIQIRQFDAQGHEITADPPELYTYHMAKQGITPPIGTNDADSADFKAVMSGGDGPYLKGSAAYNKAVAMTRMVGLMFYWLGRRTEDELKQAESHWQQGDCIGVSGTPAQPQLAPGESTTIDVTVTPPAGKSLAPGRLEASSADGQVSPANASYTADGHVQLTFTAPSSSAWSQGTGAVINLKAISREGTATNSVLVKPVKDTYTLSVTSDMEETFSPVKYEYGTGSASYSVGGQATISGGAGSGALTWSGFSYSDQDVEEGCQDGKSMTADFTGTGTDPGQMIVSGLDLSSGDPSLTLEIDDPTEHVLGDFQSGASACGPFTQTYDFHNWAYFVERACFDGPSGVAWKGVGGTTYSEVLTLTGWQQSGSSYVKDLTYTPNLYPPGDTGTAHLEFVLTPSG